MNKTQNMKSDFLLTAPDGWEFYKTGCFLHTGIRYCQLRNKEGRIVVGQADSQREAFEEAVKQTGEWE